ncbi:diguanylate cyclase domain-containing protein, partial [Staphylococcus aureus]|uniref:diguanylate cyclase domain-containing protein n=1 Tax=Staphylococcus aureus TaxID=1280 RepID=UPI0034CF7C64
MAMTLPFCMKSRIFALPCRNIVSILRKAFSQPFNIFGQDYEITLSMGVAFYPDHGRQLDYLNNCAEQALSEAKNLGGNTIHFYSSENTALLEQGIFIERDLRKA